jgi:hypothetical protein
MENWSQAADPSPRRDNLPEDSLRWEYAHLVERPGKRGRLWLTLSNPDAGVKPRRRKLRGVGAWTALGLLGEEGWELVSVSGSQFVFKRPVSG